MTHEEPAVTSAGPPSPADEDERLRSLAGQSIDDFQIERFIGGGGMGYVYRAIQISLKRPVALEVLRPRASLGRFEAEAAAVARLNHPNIVNVITRKSEGGIHFIAMEFVEGTNLRDYILKKGALELPLALSIMKQAGQAVQAAGQVGVVHRDIKPENLLLTRRGQVKVADFGLCRDVDSEGLHLTDPGVTLGTPLYMSPEQAQGHKVDHRSDLYSLGVTFYHMLAGEPPFRGDSAVSVALKHVQERPASLQVRRPEIPAELDALVLKLLAKSPAQRYQSAAEMLLDLARFRATFQTQSMAAAEPEASGFSQPVRPAVPTPGASGTSGDSSWSAARGVEAAGVASEAPTLWRPGRLAAVALLAFAIGLVAGAASRLSPAGGRSSPSRKAAPGLSLDPRWATIPKQPGAEAQFHFALLKASGDELTAAWLAVPGHFPDARDWNARAYLHAARQLYRDRDRERLAALAAELEKWPAAQTRDRELVELLDPAVKLLDRDLEGVTEVLTRIWVRTERKISDPGLIELGAEIVADASRLASQPGTAPSLRGMVRPRLLSVQARLMPLLNRVRMLDSGMNGRAG